VKRCDQCEYFLAGKTPDELGYCLLNPPVPVVVPSVGVDGTLVHVVSSVHPRVKNGCRCACFTQKKGSVPDAG